MTLVPTAAWQQRSGETAAQYAWFQRYVELGDERSPELAAKRCGVSVSVIRDAAMQHDWADRASKYDAAQRDAAALLVGDESEALAAQYAAGMIMLRLGINALALKNPALIKTQQATTLVEKGAEAVRRGAGVADLKVDHQTTKRVESLIDDLLGVESDD